MDVSESEVHAFFNDCIKVATGKDKEPNHNIDGDNDPILSVYINRERRFAFVVSIFINVDKMVCICNHID